MLDTRTKDAIRNLPGQIASLQIDVNNLRENQKTMNALLRDIKKSLVRKYTKEK